MDKVRTQLALPLLSNFYIPVRFITCKLEFQLTKTVLTYVLGQGEIRAG